MKTNFLIIIVLSSLMLFASCGTKQELNDSGVFDINQHVGKTMLEMMKEDPRNWEWTVKAIEHAGLEDLFNGNDVNYPEITFLGLKSFSIQKYIYDTPSLTGENCRTFEEFDAFLASRMSIEGATKKMLMQHIVKEIYMKDALEFKDKDYLLQAPEQTSFTVLRTEDGDKGHFIRACRETTEYNEVPDMGPVRMKLYSMTKGDYIPVVTPDLKVKNGVIHALNDNYSLSLNF